MVILLVDTEHPDVHVHPRRGPHHRARRAEAIDLLGRTAGEACVAVPFDAIDADAVARLDPSSLIIGGNTTAWDRFSHDAWDALFPIIRAAPVPILGICAGHQLIGRAHGADWGPLGELHPGERDPDSRFAPGQRKERGYVPVDLDRRSCLFDGLAPSVSVFQSHSWQLFDVPAGFLRRASSAWAAIQAIERTDRPVFGVQFHPERADHDHPAGVAVLRNFFRRARHHRSEA